MSQAVGGLSSEASKMFRVRKTCLKMLSKRGYIVDENALQMSTEQFRQKFGENPSRDSLTILAEKADDPTDQLFVFFPEDEKVGVKPIKVYCQRMKDENVFRAIIVVKVNLTPFAKTAVKEMSLRGYRCEYFRDAELLVDITEHKLVPEHIVLSNQQKLELLERYRLKPSQLPRIQLADPVARYLYPLPPMPSYMPLSTPYHMSHPYAQVLRAEAPHGGEDHPPLGDGGPLHHIQDMRIVG